MSRYPYGTGRRYVPYPDPPPTYTTVNIRTRSGTAEWFRIGFLFPAPKVDEYSHHSHHPRIPVYQHTPKCRKCQPVEPPCSCRECERNRKEFHRKEIVVEGCGRRYPLFGRPVDFGRSLWEYHVYDNLDDVRIPVGVPRHKNELVDGDIVYLVGDPQPYVVSLSELDDYWNFRDFGQRYF